MKQCSKCHEVKPLSEFYTNKHVKSGYAGRCKQCCITYQKQHIEANKEDVLQYNREYYHQYKAQVTGRQKQYRLENHDLVIERRKIYRLKNKDRINQYDREYHYRNRDRRLKGHKLYRLLHRERLNRYAKQYRLDNKEYLVALGKEYRSRNKDVINKRAQRYRIENKERIKRANREFQRSPRGRFHDALHKARRRSVTGKGDITVAFLEQLFANQCCCAYCFCPFSDMLKPTVDHVIPLVKGGTHTTDNIVLACQSCNSKKRDRLDFVAPAWLTAFYWLGVACAPCLQHPS